MPLGFIIKVRNCCWIRFDSMKFHRLISTFFFSSISEVDKNGRGLYYRNVVDCFMKILRVEGVAGLFKGIVPICFKQVPHTIVSLTTWEWLKKQRASSTAWL